VSGDDAGPDHLGMVGPAAPEVEASCAGIVARLRFG